MTENRLEFDQKNWQWQTSTLELDRNFTTINVTLWAWPKYRWMLYYNFSQIHHGNVCCCQLFGHVHRFRSFSFCHLDSVKWSSLLYLDKVLHFQLKALFLIIEELKNNVKGDLFLIRHKYKHKYNLHTNYQLQKLSKTGYKSTVCSINS